MCPVTHLVTPPETSRKGAENREKWSKANDHLRVEPEARATARKKHRNKLWYNPINVSPIDMLSVGLPDVVQTA